jgi:glycosyltransferase involved in cell wall biosynthesis
MTLAVRDEADVIEANIRYHLDAGVDFIIVTDHSSTDGTTEILRRYERDGRLQLIRREEEAFRQTEWVNEMARLAATSYGADWVINADADEFWWPHSGTLREVFAAVPARYGTIRGIWRHFVLRPEEPAPFYERMVVRRAPALEPADPYCANAKVAHRADPNVRVSRGNHDAFGERLSLLREWVPLEIFHFPIRSQQQLETKYPDKLVGHRLSGLDLVPLHIARIAKSLQENPGRLYRSLLVDDAAYEQGVAAGLLTVDTRLRDQLRGDAVTAPSLADDVAFAQEIDAMLTLDAALRLLARVDSFDRRLAAVEAKRGG